jgi:hypothetical protein
MRPHSGHSVILLIALRIEEATKKFGLVPAACPLVSDPIHVNGRNSIAGAPLQEYARDARITHDFFANSPEVSDERREASGSRRFSDPKAVFSPTSSTCNPAIP